MTTSTDPRWQMVREALEQDSGRCIDDYEGTLAALDSLEAEMEEMREVLRMGGWRKRDGYWHRVSLRGEEK